MVWPEFRFPANVAVSAVASSTAVGPPVCTSEPATKLRLLGNWKVVVMALSAELWLAGFPTTTV